MVTRRGGAVGVMLVGCRIGGGSLTWAVGVMLGGCRMWGAVSPGLASGQIGCFCQKCRPGYDKERRDLWGYAGWTWVGGVGEHSFLGFRGLAWPLLG